MTARTLITTLLLLAFGLAPSFSQAQSPAKIEVLLVMASNSGQGVDAQLKPYAGNLQRLFRFNTYQLKDRKVLDMTAPGGRNTNLYGGTDLQLGAEAVSDGKLPINLDWRRGKEKLLRTMVRLNPNTPAILGGPQSTNNTGTYLLIVRWVN
ncbi:hypothetical protein [Cerasicoccus maritimus]|uniref:hypothetical protein n=1 Tax=Cerasicoccus maritimus TaxID=490089 RepID=UPI002852C981|nr:hypothetical protein [Cerasicoccus maritimus]